MFPSLEGLGGYGLIPQRQEISSLLDRAASKEKRSFWFGPESEVIFQGNVGKPEIADFVVKNLGRAGEEFYSAKLKEGYEDLVYRGGITDDSIASTIKIVNVLDRLLGIELREYNLHKVFEIRTTDDLNLSADVGTVFTGQTRVLEAVEAQVKNQTYARTTWDLGATGKNVSHIIITDEAGKKSVHDIMQYGVKNAKKEIGNMENTQLEVLLAAATAVTGADWGAQATAGTNDNSPIWDIEAVMTTIGGNGHTPDFLAIHDKVWGETISNTQLKGNSAAEVKTVGVIEGSFAILGFPTLGVVIDQARVNTTAVVGSKSAPWAILARGPTEAAEYRNEAAGLDAYIIRQWTEAKQVIAGAVRELTGVQA